MLVGGILGLGTRQHRGAIDGGDVDRTVAAQSERKRTPNQAEADD